MRVAKRPLSSENHFCSFRNIYLAKKSKKSVQELIKYVEENRDHPLKDIRKRLREKYSFTKIFLAFQAADLKKVRELGFTKISIALILLVILNSFNIIVFGEIVLRGFLLLPIIAFIYLFKTKRSSYSSLLINSIISYSLTVTILGILSLVLLETMIELEVTPYLLLIIALIVVAVLGSIKIFEEIIEYFQRFFVEEKIKHHTLLFLSFGVLLFIAFSVVSLSFADEQKEGTEKFQREYSTTLENSIQEMKNNNASKNEVEIRKRSKIMFETLQKEIPLEDEGNLISTKVYFYSNIPFITQEKFPKFVLIFHNIFGKYLFAANQYEEYLELVEKEVLDKALEKFEILNYRTINQDDYFDHLQKERNSLLIPNYKYRMINLFDIKVKEFRTRSSSDIYKEILSEHKPQIESFSRKAESLDPNIEIMRKIIENDEQEEFNIFLLESVLNSTSSSHNLQASSE